MPSAQLPTPATGAKSATKTPTIVEYMVIIALTISRPGTYHVHKVKMTYVMRRRVIGATLG